MGLGEMMGVKNIKLELKGNYASLAELLEAMQNVKFEAGIPELTKHGIGSVIVFPPVDRNNQVWITGAKGKFTVMRSAEEHGKERHPGLPDRRSQQHERRFRQ